MADEGNEVVIKIAADVSTAAVALELLVEGMADLITATNNVTKAIEGMGSKVGKASDKAKGKTEGFWASFLHGVTGAQVGAVAMGTQMSKVFDKIGEGVREAVTAFPNMVKHVADAGDEMLTLSNRIGVSVEDLGELKYISGQSGASMEGMARTIQGLNGTFNESGEKGQKARDAIKSIGLSVEDLKKQDPKAAFFEIIQAIQGTVPAADQGRVAMEIFGSRFRNNTMLLKEDIGGLQAKFKELGGGMTTDLAKAGDEYADNIKNIEQVQENFKDQIVGAVLPAVNSMLEAFPQLGGFVLTVGEGILDLVKSFGPLLVQLLASKLAFAENAVAAQASAVATTEMVVAEEAATVATGGLTVAMDLLMGPVGWIIGAITLLVGAFVLLNKTETESEKQSRTNAVAFKQHTDSLSESLKVYDELHGKLKLNKEETEKLEAATLALAKASGISAEAFKTDAAAADLALKHVRDLLAGDQKLLAVATERARKAQEEAKYQLERAQAEKTAITEKHEVVGAGWRGAPVKKKVTDEQAYDALIKQDAKVADLQAKLEALTHTYQVLTDTVPKATAATKAHGTAMDEIAAGVVRSKKIIADLTAIQRTQLSEAIKGNADTKKTAEALLTDLKAAHPETTIEDVTRALGIFKDQAKEAEAAAKKIPFVKLAEDAKNLSEKLTEATTAGISQATQMATDGKKAADLIKEFRERGKIDQLPANIKAIGAAWVEADLAEKMKSIAKAAEEMARSWQEDATAGAQAAADAAKKMGRDIAASHMSAQQAAHQAIVNEEEDRVESLKRQTDALDKKMIAENTKITENFALRRKNEEAAAAELGLAVSKEKKEATDRDEQNQRAALATSIASQKIGLSQELQDVITFYENRLKAQEHNLEDGEENLKTWGDKVKSAAVEEPADQKKHLDALKAMNDPYYAEQIRHLEELVDANERALDAIEASAAAHGVKTTAVKKAEFDKQLKFQLEMADSIARGEKKYNAEDLKAQQAKTDAARDAMSEQGQMAERLGIKTKSMLDKEAAHQHDVLNEMIERRKNGDTEITASAIAAQTKVVEAADKAAKSQTAAYEQMGNAVLDIFAQIASKGPKDFQAMASGMQKAGKAGDDMKSSFVDLKGAWNAKDAAGLVQGGLGMAQAGIAGVQAIKEATNTLSTKKNVLGGAMAGGKMGMQIAGPWGAAVGAGVGAIVGAFRNKGAMRAAKQAASDFGAEIPVELAKSIEKESKKQFKGDRLPAEMLHFGEILEAAGGITDKNVGKMQARMTDAINLTKQGKLTVEQTTKILDDSFGAFAKHTLESGKIASKGFTDMIKGAEGLGIKSKEIADFVGSQVDRLGNAFAVMISPLAKQAGEIGAKVVEQKQKLEEARKATEGEDISEDAQKKLDEQSAAYDDLIAKQKAMAEDSLPKINRAARLMTATFNEAVASGMSMTEAVDRMGPGLDTLIQATKDLGMTVEDTSVGFLASFRDRINTNRELVDSAASLNDIMLAMSNIGALNADTFLDLQAQGLETYDQLDKAGFSQNEILSQMKPFLEQARQAHTDLKLPIDENTAALIKQAEEHGILKEQAKDTNTVLMEGFSALIEAVGGKLPDAFKKMKEAALEASQKAAAGMKGVDGAATGVQSSLASTDWDGWSADAVAAASAAQAAVDGVSLGSSPGGLKEIPIQIEKSLKAFSLFERFGVKSAKSVKNAVEDIRPDTAKPGEATSATDVMAVVTAVEESVKASADAMQQMQESVVPMTEAVQAMQPITEEIKSSVEAAQMQDDESRIAAQRAMNVATQAAAEATRTIKNPFTKQDITIAIDRPILKDRESMMDLTKEVSKHLRQALGNTGAWFGRG